MLSDVSISQKNTKGVAKFVPQHIGIMRCKFLPGPYIWSPLVDVLFFYYMCTQLVVSVGDLEF